MYGIAVRITAAPQMIVYARLIYITPTYVKLIYLMLSYLQLIIYHFFLVLVLTLECLLGIKQHTNILWNLKSQKMQNVYLLLPEDADVMELVQGACTERIYPVGRLDKNSLGLLLFKRPI